MISGKTPTILILFLLCETAWCQSFQFTVRDSQTGAPIEAEIRLQTINQDELTAQQWDQIKRGHAWPEDLPIIQQQSLLAKNFFFHLAPKEHLQLVRIAADGYHPLYSHVEANSNTPISHIMLDPLTNNRKSKGPCDQATLCGYLYDQSTALPMADVAVTVTGHRYQAQNFTAIDGSFVFHDPLPAVVVITVQHSGYRTRHYTDVDTASPLHMVIDLSPGSGRQETSLMHPLSGMPIDQVDPQWLKAKLHHVPSTDAPTSARERSTGAVYLAPPASIRVGFDGSGGSCCGANCATSQVFSLETYVQRGLDNEWISSWDADSLKAGTIPYRSYGAWHVMNGTYPGYDICAGPCCQAFEYTGYTAPINAAIATNGLMLDRNGKLARSEYSAQNNSWDDPNDGLNCSNVDLSCGDGAVGSPATGWSCLADPLATGLGCFGHGRGMSQWGTKFHADAGATFADIVDHYYNANNNPSGQRNQYASTPVRLDAITTDVLVLPILDLFTIDYEVFNSSDASHAFGPLLLGASLYDGQTYYSDPANDGVASINQAGTTTMQRAFQLDAAVLPGVYDLVTALYLDVDDNGQISSTDWLLQTNTEVAALQVLAADDLIFRDSF